MNKINNYEQKYSLLKKRIELSDTKVKSLTKSLKDAARIQIISAPLMVKR